MENGRAEMGQSGFKTGSVGIGVMIPRLLCSPALFDDRMSVRAPVCDETDGQNGTTMPAFKTQLNPLLIKTGSLHDIRSGVVQICRKAPENAASDKDPGGVTGRLAGSGRADDVRDVVSKEDERYGHTLRQGCAAALRMAGRQAVRLLHSARADSSAVCASSDLARTVAPVLSLVGGNTDSARLRTPYDARNPPGSPRHRRVMRARAVYPRAAALARGMMTCTLPERTMAARSASAQCAAPGATVPGPRGTLAIILRNAGESRGRPGAVPAAAANAGAALRTARPSRRVRPRR